MDCRVGSQPTRNGSSIANHAKYAKTAQAGPFDSAQGRLGHRQPEEVLTPRHEDTKGERKPTMRPQISQIAADGLSCNLAPREVGALLGLRSA
jgi:hypothetical protein